MKGRRQKAEGRRHKAESRGASGLRLFQRTVVETNARHANLGFVFRAMLAGVWLLAAHRLFAAATNLAGGDEIPPLRPPHGEIPPTFWEQHGLWVVLGGVAVLALAGAGAWLLTRSKSPVVVAPEEQARRALEPLRELPEDGALLSQVSQVLRHYVSAASNLPPEELTTAEFCRALAGQDQIGPELSAALGEFLRQCDARKFAPPAPSLPLGAIAQALKLIEQTQARRASVAQSAAQPTPSSVATPPKPANDR